MPNHSVPAAAVHMGKEAVFAVVASMLDLQNGGARCSGVTLLPPGPAWLARALLTFGLDASRLEDSLALDEREAAAAIDLSFRELGDDLSPSPELIEAVQDLFDVPPAERYQPVEHGAEHVVLQPSVTAASKLRARRQLSNARIMGAAASASTPSG
jgi:hypothetical protein